MLLFLTWVAFVDLESYPREIRFELTEVICAQICRRSKSGLNTLTSCSLSRLQSIPSPKAQRHDMLLNPKIIIVTNFGRSTRAPERPLRPANLFILLLLITKKPNQKGPHHWQLAVDQLNYVIHNTHFLFLSLHVCLHMFLRARTSTNTCACEGHRSLEPWVKGRSSIHCLFPQATKCYSHSASRW